MIDMQGIVLADTIQQAERNLLEIDSVDWAEVKAELEPLEFDDAFMDREGYLTLAAVSYTHLTLPTRACRCRSRWSPYH